MPLLLSTRMITGTGCLSGVNPATAAAQSAAMTPATLATIQARLADLSARCARSSSQVCASVRYLSRTGSRCIVVPLHRGIRARIDRDQISFALWRQRRLASAARETGDQEKQTEAFHEASSHRDGETVERC